ncbi:2-hydroxyacid dehydrogenase [Flavobacteriaceae bacterium]|mgnify:FL=1|jgi:D-3-phosphoglycerate dehydrogenase / 2-oxoglutarate reductase|nr:2-hydroxyacid dehydrogenase [Flavobacteriaceae bacterium]MDA8849624.1 2-hydroxyacid dehydrogenase [Flavobacteriaceae bacterium]MDB4063880.1 2-hydroxyacid dehydrogenase [Flavobacteriaceae bacterium]MDB4235188.1 2-hydroxyacid dehydrogenase [bacterium]MDC1392243.1 2-hydroxyacid dehydrogenase [Flavobacteriaceae bacterium]
MNAPLILHVDENHPLLVEGLETLGYKNILAYETPIKEVLKNLHHYSGMVIRSRFPINKEFIDAGKNLKFIARVGAGMENIDVEYAQIKNILLIAAPEGNKNAVGEHTLGLLLSLMNKLRNGHQSIRQGDWLREEHRGWELEGKTIGIIGYGNTGKKFAEKLKGFNVTILYNDILQGIGDKNATEASIKTLQEKSDVLSLHIPQNDSTYRMINTSFIKAMKKPFWFLNTARGKAVVTEDLVEGLNSGKILGAGLDVLEYESSSFRSIFKKANRPKALEHLLSAENVLLSPHVGGWTFESHRKLAQTILNKIKIL